MLEYLNIKNFALIDELSLPFHEGLTVLTGETGAGKSIIVDALQTVLGEKADAAVVRTGRESARVEASFDPGAGGDHAAAGEDGQVVRREIPRKGRSRAFLNGALVPVSQLKTSAGTLVDLHGQHEHQSLLRVGTHLQVLDVFAGVTKLAQRCGGLFRERADCLRKIDRAREGEKERLARIDYLKFVVNELGSAGLSVTEEEELKDEERILSSSQALLSASGQALETVYQAEGSLSEKLGQVVNSLRDLVEVDPRLAEIVDLLQESRTQVDESGHLLRDYVGKIQSDPQRLNHVADRLAFIGDMKKKYGPSVPDVLETLESSKQDLASLGDGEVDLDSVRNRVDELEAELGELTAELRKNRKERALRMEEKVLLQLRDLAMEKVRFQVHFEEKDLEENGIDSVEFLISPNPGEPLMPLRKIASGGELSRVMLAIKRILAGSHFVPTLVFDEVDAGIGGRVAAILGRKLKEISANHQVLCITHLASVAACADHHVYVEKSQAKGRTAVTARYLSGEERVLELARMMGGMEPTRGIVDSARELLEESIGQG